MSRCFCVHAYFYAQFNFGKYASLTSSPRTSSISLFSLSPGPMCRSVKSSCRGNILSICLEEMAAEVLRALTAASADDDGDGEQADAPWVRNLPWTFNARRLLVVRCRHGALGFADLAKKSPQDLAQLCISAISLKEGSINPKRCLALSPPIPAGISANSKKTRIYTTASFHKIGPIRTQRSAWRGQDAR